MTERPRIALIGCGFFARNHMHAWADAGAEVAAVCDLDPEKANIFARDFGAARYTDAAAMLAELKPDVVDIVTTVASHRRLVELAAGKAKVVVCQKPFAETITDAKAMVAACERRGSTLLVHENFRWQLPFRSLKSAMAEIGAPRFMRLNFSHAFDIYGNQPYLAEVEDLALTDIGLHLFDMARFLMGDVTNVFCRTRRLNPRVAGQDAFWASLAHASGAVSSIECSFFAPREPDPFPQTLALIQGEHGTLEIKEDYQLVRYVAGAQHEGVEPEVPSWGEKPWHGIQESVQAFNAHVLEVLGGRANPQPSGAHNLETLAVTLAAIRSSRTGAAVDVKTVLDAA
ncbi:MAG: Gfo/Idh/MocA family oxidoreductase [Rhizobiaceae bacterium]|jgi:predicted dehydrogenase|nr:Gfo/Idh/MocA family oxidoreductase [Rhizobiaceae bacterium]